MAANVTIREATSTDVGALAEVQRRASLAGFAHIFPPDRYPFPTAAVLERWAAALTDPNVETFVARVDEALIGLAAVRPGWLEALYVDPERWGTGVAAQLHDRAVARLRTLGSDQARLWVLEGNGRARSFYERRGWRPNGGTRRVPFPPHPLDVGYTLELAAESRL